MYNGKFENNNAAERKTAFRYWPLVFIVLISITVVLLSYWLCLITIDGIKAMYVFMTENINNISIPVEVWIVLLVIGLLVGFAIVLKKFYFGEWNEPVQMTPVHEESSAVLKPVEATKHSKSHHAKPQGKRRTHESTAGYEVSPNEVVWTPAEPSKRYGYKF